MHVAFRRVRCKTSPANTGQNVLTWREVVDRFANNNAQDTPEGTDAVFTEDNTEEEEDHRSVGRRSSESESHPFEKTTDDEATPKIADTPCHRDRVACWMEGPPDETHPHDHEEESETHSPCHKGHRWYVRVARKSEETGEPTELTDMPNRGTNAAACASHCTTEPIEFTERCPK